MCRVGREWLFILLNELLALYKAVLLLQLLMVLIKNSLIMSFRIILALLAVYIPITLILT